MDYYLLDNIEVAGFPGEQTKFVDYRYSPVIIEYLHYLFLGWLGNELIKTRHNTYLVTENLKIAIEKSNIKGIIFKDVYVTKSINYFSSIDELPVFFWMVVYGDKDVFLKRIDDIYELIVSDNFFNILKEFNISGINAVKYFPITDPFKKNPD